MNSVKPESVALFCLAPDGVALAKRLAAMLPVTCLASSKLADAQVSAFENDLAEAVCEAFSSYSVLIFIGAPGIAGRLLTPLITDKFSDPVVVIIDERGQRVISLPAGHAGGANALTRYLAMMLGADPVITIATDVNQLAASHIVLPTSNPA